MLPIIRLRVLYDSPLPLGNVARFGQEFSGRIANTRDVLQLHLRRARQARAPAIQIDSDMVPAEKLERVSIEKLVEDTLGTQHLDVLNPKELQRSVMSYINKDECVFTNSRDAIETYVTHALARFEDTLAAGGLEESRLQAGIERLCQENSGSENTPLAQNAPAPSLREPSPPPPTPPVLDLSQESPPRQRRRTREQPSTPRSNRLAALGMIGSRPRRSTQQP